MMGVLNVLSIEARKIFLQKKTYVIWIVFILMLLLNYNTNIIDRTHMISSSLNNISNIKDVNQSLQNIKSRLSDKSISNKEKIEYETYFKNIEEQLSNFNIIMNKTTNDMLKIKSKIQIIKGKLLEISEGKLFTSISAAEYNKELRFLQYLYDNKIPEGTGGQNSFKFIFNFLASYLSILFVLLIILFASDNVPKELEESTIKLILIQPISRVKILTGKYLALVISIITITLSTFLSFFVVIGLKDGIGNPSYPYISNMKYSFDKISHSYNYIAGSGVYNSSLKLLIKIILLFLLIILVAMSISFMISVFLNTSTMSMSINIIVFVGLTYIVFATNILNNIKQYIYISYSIPYNVVSGSITENLNNNQISPLLGVMQMFFIIAVTYIVSCIAFANKDI